MSKDGLTLKYKLRPNIRWQDGQPLTCNDMKFTWQVVMNPHNNVVTTDGYKDIGSIDCSDPHVAVIHMKKLYAPFLQQLWSENGNAPILPEHLPTQLPVRSNKPHQSTPSPLGAPHFQVPDGNPTLRDVEMKYIQTILEKHNGNKPAASRELGISLKTLYNKINQLQNS